MSRETKPMWRGNVDDRSIWIDSEENLWDLKLKLVLLRVLSQTMDALLVALLLASFLLLLSGIFMLNIVWYYSKAKLLRAVMDKQGILGPLGPVNPHFDIFYGKADMKEFSHDIFGYVLPWMAANVKLFGKVHFNLWLREPRIVIAEPKMMWDAFIRNHECFKKPHVINILSDDILYGGTFHADGEAWARQRKVIAPSYYLNKVKAMVDGMVSATLSMLSNWESLIDEKGQEVDVQLEFMNLNVEIVARTAFGISGSTSKSESIVQHIVKLLKLQDEQEPWSWLPFARILPFKINFCRWRTRRQLNDLVLQQVKERKISRGNDPSHIDDLLGIMLDNYTMNLDLIVAECRTLYATGFVSLAPLLSFTMLMLATNPSWQERARTEVEEVLKGKPIDAKALNQLKIIEMILRETMRLYPTMPLIARVCTKDTTLGGVFIPKGLGLTIAVIALHHDKDLWGDDVHKFNPERFVNGTVAAAKHRMAFMPFSFGVRTCIGRAFSEVQCKIVIASILQRFLIKPSPNYRHHPVITGPLIPKYGMPVLLERRIKD